MVGMHQENAAIRAVVRSAIYYGCKVYGVNRGYKGLIESDLVEMDLSSVGDIIIEEELFLNHQDVKNSKLKKVDKKQLKFLRNME